MSHAVHWQLPLFFANIAKVLKENGKVVFSIRLTKTNEYGNEGVAQETHAQEWQYPACSFFDKFPVIKEASKWFKMIKLKKEFTAIITADNPGA